MQPLGNPSLVCQTPADMCSGSAMTLYLNTHQLSELLASSGSPACACLQMVLMHMQELCSLRVQRFCNRDASCETYNMVETADHLAFVIQLIKMGAKQYWSAACQLVGLFSASEFNSSRDHQQTCAEGLA